MPQDSSQNTYDFVLYGAYGYTGKLITELAHQQKLKPLLAGRKEEPLAKLASTLNLPYQTLDLEDTKGLDQLLASAPVVLHAAGPYSATAQPMVEACLRTATNYIDITGEIEVFEWIAAQKERALAAKVVLLPGAGFDVVPTDCLAAYVASGIDNPTHLDIVIKSLSSVSRGTALTAVENLGSSSYCREGGQLKQVDLAHASRFVDFGKGQRLAASIPWGDIATAYRSTGVPNIITYMQTSPRTYQMMRAAKSWRWLLKAKGVQKFLRKQVNRKITGPTEEVRDTSKSFVWAEARNAAGATKTARLTTMEAYKLTALTALDATLRVSRGEVSAGFHTPATAFGADYILDFEGSIREDL
ncbi:MAG: saccharopine dehydrogenase NADP-binding domain-containing protein [Bacteroidota bacterium]